jgi:polysaccharide deacetylase family protein (PEP-CTERM system associated)
MKVAVLSMDIEDWYHLDYFHGMDCDRNHSLLDGVSIYREVLSEQDIHSSFFVLGELVQRNRRLLSELVEDGHDVGAHSWSHIRPLKMSLREFKEDLKKSKHALEDATQTGVQGYRAPCFSLDRTRLDLVREIGFLFDSSYISFDAHPLYGRIDLTGFAVQLPGIYRDEDFFEFEISTLHLAGKDIPVSGGGYLRIFPWFLMGSLVKWYLMGHSIYSLYIHPFELSPQRVVPLPREARRPARMRFGLGRSSTRRKLSLLIALLKSKGFRFTTFATLRKELLADGTYNG